MAITIVAQSVTDNTGNLSSYTSSTTIPGGTTCLVVGIEFRGEGSAADLITSVTHNGNALTEGFDNVAGGLQDVNTWWGYLRNPDIGTFDIIVNLDGPIRGCKMWRLGLSGVKTTGSIFGVVDAQRNTSPATDTVGLGLTPSAGTSLLLASLSISTATTLSSFTGAGYTTVATAQYTNSNNLTSTSRYLLNAPASVNTVSATFAVADTNIGGSLIEVLAEATGVDVSGNITFGLAVTGSVSVTGVSGSSTARIGDASFRNGRSAWTEVLLLQPDAAGVDRRIISAGPAAAPTYKLDMIQTGTSGTNVYRWQYRLADGVVTVETGPGTQTTAAHVIALVHQPGDPTAYVNGIESVSSLTGNARVGVLDLGSGGQAFGGHDQASPAPYTGLMGRYLAYDGVLTAAQVRLLSMSLLDPDSLWGYGSENDAQVANRSPVAVPILVEPDGRPTMTIRPRTVDVDGTQPTIASVTQGVHTTVVIATNELDLVLTFERGWQGRDTFSYVASDVSKSSTGKVFVDQQRPALLARNDAITVEANSSIVFDPRLNDVGAGPLTVVSVTTPGAGTAVIEGGRIRYTPAGGTSVWTLDYTFANSASEWLKWGGAGGGITAAGADGLRFYGGPGTVSTNNMMSWANRQLPAGGNWRIEFEYKRVDTIPEPGDPSPGVASQLWVGSGINAFPAGILTYSGPETSDPSVSGMGPNVFGGRQTFNTAYNANTDLNSQLRYTILPSDDPISSSPNTFPFTAGTFYSMRFELNGGTFTITDGVQTFVATTTQAPQGRVFGIYLQSVRDVRIRNVRIYRK